MAAATTTGATPAGIGRRASVVMAAAATTAGTASTATSRRQNTGCEGACAVQDFSLFRQFIQAFCWDADIQGELGIEYYVMKFLARKLIAQGC